MHELSNQRQSLLFSPGRPAEPDGYVERNRRFEITTTNWCSPYYDLAVTP